jgi:all-trans-retinol dehydrogenase (NAD+)
MLKHNKGHIVNMASVCGLTGGYKLTDYCASKFAAVGFTESLRAELRLANPSCQLVVSAVCPFHVRTKLFQGVDILHLKWLGMTMDVDYVTDCVIDGVLRNKELIFIPKATVHLFACVKK